MNRQRWLQIINPLLFLLVLWQAATAIFHDALYALPVEEAFEKLHVLTGFALALLALLHLWLNWDWVVARYLRRRPRPTPAAPAPASPAAPGDAP